MPQQCMGVKIWKATASLLVSFSNKTLVHVHVKDVKFIKLKRNLRKQQTQEYEFLPCRQVEFSSETSKNFNL